MRHRFRPQLRPMLGRLVTRRLPGTGLTALAILGGLAAAPTEASAVDRYVDAETGADSGAACVQANPCDTIAYALGTR